MQNKMQINDCPFCNATVDKVCTIEGYTVYDGFQLVIFYYVYCESCCARGSQKTTKKVAVHQWNSALTFANVESLKCRIKE